MDFCRAAQASIPYYVEGNTSREKINGQDQKSNNFNVLYNFTAFDTILQEVAATHAMLELLFENLKVKVAIFQSH